MDEEKLILKRWVLANYTNLKSFTFWKMRVNLCNFRIPVYKGFLSQGLSESHRLTMSAEQL